MPFYQRTLPYWRTKISAFEDYMKYWREGEEEDGCRQGKKEDCREREWIGGGKERSSLLKANSCKRNRERERELEKQRKRKPYRLCTASFRLHTIWRFSFRFLSFSFSGPLSPFPHSLVRLLTVRKRFVRQS